MTVHSTSWLQPTALHLVLLNCVKAALRAVRGLRKVDPKKSNVGKGFQLNTKCVVLKSVLIQFSTAASISSHINSHTMSCFVTTNNSDWNKVLMALIRDIKTGRRDQLLTKTNHVSHLWKITVKLCSYTGKPFNRLMKLLGWKNTQCLKGAKMKSSS